MRVPQVPMRRNHHFCLHFEFAGTALMLFIGVSAVAFMWAPGSPVPVVTSGLRRLADRHYVRRRRHRWSFIRRSGKLAAGTSIRP